MNKIAEKQQAVAWAVHVAGMVMLLLVLVTVYSNTFQAPFVFDDLENIVQKTSVQMTSITHRSLLRATFDGANARRWLPNLSYGVNYYFGGSEVWGYHLLNLVVHLLAAMVLYGLFFTTLTLPRLGFSPRRAAEIALISALVWGVHPLQTNAVTYIVQRMTSMAALFSLASLWFYVRGRLHCHGAGRRYFFWAASFVCGVLALVSKENSAILPLVIVGYEYYFLKDKARWVLSRQRMALLGLTSASFLVAGWFYVGRAGLQSVLHGYAARDFTLIERLMTQARIIFHYLSLIALPLPSRMNFNYDYVISRSLLSPPLTLVAIIGIAVLVWLTIFLFRRQRLLSFGLFWFLVNLLVESTVIPLELIFEHRLYLPSTMLIMAVVATLSGIFKSRPKILRGVWTAGIIVLSLFTWQRNLVWGSEISLWRDVLAKSPHLPRVYLYLGRAYNLEERYQEAFDVFQQAAEQDFNEVNIYNNWGLAAFQLGKIELAVKLLERAVQLDPTHAESHYNLGVAYGSQGRVAEARREMVLGMGLQRPK